MNVSTTKTFFKELLTITLFVLALNSASAIYDHRPDVPAFQPQFPAVGADDSAVHYHYFFVGSPNWAGDPDSFDFYHQTYTEERITRTKTNGTTVVETYRQAYDTNNFSYTFCSPPSISYTNDYQYCSGAATNGVGYLSCIDTNALQSISPFWYFDTSEIVQNLTTNYLATNIYLVTANSYGESFNHGGDGASCGTAPAWVFMRVGNYYQIEGDFYAGLTNPSLPLPQSMNGAYWVGTNLLVNCTNLVYSNGTFFITLRGATYTTATFEASTDLNSWSTIGSLTFPDSPPGIAPFVTETNATFIDTGAISVSNRFYRYALSNSHATWTNEIKSDAVGFINVIAFPGYTMLANQLVNQTGNSISNLMKNVPNGFTVYKFDPNMQQYTDSFYTSRGGWNNASIPLWPGEGVFVFNPASTNVIETFTGFVPTVQLTDALSPNSSICSSILPVADNLNNLNFPPVLGDQVNRWDPAAQNWVSYTYGRGGWSPAVPALNLGEAFFLASGTNSWRTWTNNFVLWP